MSSGPRLLLLLALLCYLPALRNGFVWDDVPLIVQNRLTGEPGNIPGFFTQELWDGAPVESGVSGYYRPLFLLTLSLDRALYGLSAAGAHLHSLLWHLLATAGMARLTRGLLEPRAALLATALFALHPVQSEAVVWVAARNDPMAAAACLWALALAREGAAPLGVVLLSLMATLSKETALLLPLAQLLLERASPSGQRRPYLPLIVGLGLGLGLRLLSGVGGSALPSLDTGVYALPRLPGVLAVYASTVVAPWPLSVDRTLEWLELHHPLRLLSGALALIGGLLWAWRRPAARPGLALASLWWSPSLLPIVDKGLLGERYLYLPMAGLGLALGPELGRLPRPALGGLGLLALFLIQLRLPDWKDDRSLWSAELAHHPSPFAHESLAHALRAEGELGSALEHFRLALDDPHPELHACPRLVGTALEMEAGGAGRGLALGAAEWARGRGCKGPSFDGQVALALIHAGRWSEAEGLVAGAGVDPEGRLQLAGCALSLRLGQPCGDPALEERAAALLGSL